MANLPLLDPFSSLVDYPSSTIASLRSGHSTCTRFSPCGQYLASGRVDGTVVVFDVDTIVAGGSGGGVAWKGRGHRGQVGGVSWSGDSRYLLTTSANDWSLRLWDLAKREGEAGWCRAVSVGKMCYGAEFSGVDSSLAVVVPFESAPFLLDLTPTATRQHVLSSLSKRTAAELEALTEKQLATDAKTQTTTAIFTNDGLYVLAGTSKGYLNIIPAKEPYETIYSMKVCSGAIISIRVSSSGRSLVLNCQDRVIRSINLPDLTKDMDADKIHLEVEHKFSDVVNRLSWNHVAFSGTGDYVVASTFNNHDIYIWERGHGSLVKILEGTLSSSGGGGGQGKEEIGSVEWHPTKPMIAATGLESGRIHVWGELPVQRWARLAPDFVEVDENVEYVEQEDEFDIHPEEERRKQMLDAEGEDVDVLGGGTTAGEKKGVGWRVPILLDLGDESEDEFIMVGTGTMRRKSPGAGERREVAGGEGEGSGLSWAEADGTPGERKKRGRGRKK